MGRKRKYTESQLTDLGKRFTPKEIAELFGVKVETIYTICLKYGVKCVDARFEFDPDSVSPQWLIERRKQFKISHEEFAKQLGITPRLLESWMYERDVPKTYRRIIWLAIETLRNRFNALNSKLRTGRQKSNPRVR